ncbi:winged helix DNA-binding domain-containing protein, partial [Cellulomonas rhizosphaerae]
MDALEVAHLRLRNQHLAGPPLADAAAVVRHLGAVQAQELAMARWSLGQRSLARDDTEVRRALDAGEIVRTHALRPTWHFVAPEDLRWIQALTGPRVRIASRYYEARSGIDDELAARATALMADAVRGKNHLTRPELGAALATGGIEAAGVRLSYLVMRAELDAVLVNGVQRGKQQTYALADERIASSRDLTGDDAVAELTRRYLASHGPATVKDLGWWSSLTLTQVRRGIALLGDTVVAHDVGGTTFWSVPGPAVVREPSPTVHVLQGYDAYGVAYSEGRSVLNIAGLVLAPD